METNSQTVSASPISNTSQVQGQNPVQVKKKSNALLIVVIVIVVLLVLCGLCVGGTFLATKYVADNAEKAGKDLGNKVSNEIGNQINSKISDTVNSVGSDLINPDGTSDGAIVPTVSLPDGFPTDIPLIPGYKLTTASKTTVTTGTQYMATLTVAKSSADVIAYYEEQLKAQGWTVNTSNLFFINSIVATKSGKQLTVTVIGGSDSKNANSMVSLTYVSK
ncbi:MAG: hypothetical protein WCK31_00010 [bacterium]